MTSELQGIDHTIFGIMLVIFLTITILLGIYGYRHTKNNKEYLIGKGKTNPVVLALSYGATFLSASAIIGFGGQAAVHGMSLIWLCFLNLFLGLLVAFVVFGRRTRRLGKKLGASTFADLMGKIYKSNGIRAFTAIMIIVMMPIYCAAVLKGGVNSLAVITGLTEYYDIILVVLALVVGVYVVYGGIIAVIYNDALQAGIMFIGMAVILVVTYVSLGGVTEANSALSDLWETGIFNNTGTLPGFNGWAGFADLGSTEWMLVVTTFIMGVGIGAVTQPQLIVRFMTAGDDKTLDKSLIVGSIFMLVIVGAAYTVGALSNVYFFNTTEMISFDFISSLGLNIDYIIPAFVLELFKDISFGDLFVSLFLLSLVCASISTISALMHTVGAAGGYDLNSAIHKIKFNEDKDMHNIRTTRIFTALVMILVVVYCYLMPGDIIAKATSLFMGVMAAAMLPSFAYGLYSKNPKKEIAIASMAGGTIMYLFWALFINAGMSIFLPICELLTGSAVLFPDSIVAFVDPLIIALPFSSWIMATLLLKEKTDASTQIGA